MPCSLVCGNVFALTGVENAGWFFRFANLGITRSNIVHHGLSGFFKRLGFSRVSKQWFFTGNAFALRAFSISCICSSVASKRSNTARTSSFNFAPSCEAKNL